MSFQGQPCLVSSAGWGRLGCEEPHLAALGYSGQGALGPNTQSSHFLDQWQTRKSGGLYHSCVLHMHSHKCEYFGLNCFYFAFANLFLGAEEFRVAIKRNFFKGLLLFSRLRTSRI